MVWTNTIERRYVRTNPILTVVSRVTFSILFFPTMTTLRALMADSGPSSVSMRLLYRSRNIRFGKLAKLVILLMRLFW